MTPEQIAAIRERNEWRRDHSDGSSPTRLQGRFYGAEDDIDALLAEVIVHPEPPPNHTALCLLCGVTRVGAAHTLRACRDALAESLAASQKDLARHVSIGTAWRNRADRLRQQRDAELPE
jgi:hypothetical protein